MSIQEHEDNPEGLREPENAARLELVDVLLRGGSHAEALEQAARVLQSDPVNLRALEAAAHASDALGHPDRAEGYRRILYALQPADSAPPAPPPPSYPEDSNMELHRPTVRLLRPGSEADEPWAAETATITLADVAGMEAVKQRLQTAFLGPLQRPDLRQLYGTSLRGGLLLYGPPGCGKTYIARATAGELGARFIAVGLSDVLDMWLGESERKLHEIFESARRSAPAVLFFDEIDALGQKRSHLRHSAGRNVVNQLLFELDGLTEDNDGIFVLAATNHPWDVDTALLRPGRFDRLALVVPPDQEARRAIIELNLRGRPASDIDASWIAKQTDGFSGADLAHLCTAATERALEASMQAAAARPITTDDFRAALKDVRPSTRAWFDTARNYVMFANDAGTYDDLLTYMRAHKLV